jgi:dTMP kinase
MLIVFEGLDNCGKTTIVERLKDYLDKQGISAEFTREFETDVGKLIKK